ncbi:MAG: YraN family protein [Acidobacteriia bacterium]|nr:YraN family protein [Terriglobia bacterium]
MSGRLTHAALRALDRVNRALLPKSKRAEHLQTGRRGEEDAYFYLRRQGYVMVARNWRSPRRKGELDLIGYDGDTLCFVEVKTRTTMDVKPAEAAVDQEKRHDLSAVAREYLRRLPQHPAHRFDILSIYYLGDGGKLPQFALFKNCFPLS